MAADIVSNLAAWYKFDGDALDASANGVNGTAFNSPDYVTGVHGNAIRFTNAAAQKSVSLGPTLLNSESAVTVSAWVKFIAIADFYAPWSKYSTTSNRFGVTLGGTGAGSNTGLLVMAASGGNAYGVTAGGLLTTDVWYRLTQVFDGTQTGNANRLKIYIGKVSQSLTFTGTIPAATANLTSTAFVWGRHSATYSDMILDDARIYLRALDQDSIDALVDYSPATFKSAWAANSNQVIA